MNLKERKKEFLNVNFKPGDFIIANVDLCRNRTTSILIFEEDSYYLNINAACWVLPIYFKSFSKMYKKCTGLLPLYKSYSDYYDYLRGDYFEMKLLDFSKNSGGNINDYSKESILKMKKKEITPKVKAVIRYFMKDDKKFAIDVYKKNWIFNNELFYDIYSENLNPVKFTLEEIKEIIEAKPFNSKAYVMGSSQMQCQNAVNHLLKTQDLTPELMTIIFEKYKDDNEVFLSTLNFILTSKKVKTTADINNLIAETIVMNSELHTLVRNFKKKIDIKEITDDTVKLLLECIE